MLRQDSEDEMLHWQNELNPQVHYAFGNVYFPGQGWDLLNPGWKGVLCEQYVIILVIASIECSNNFRQLL